MLEKSIRAADDTLDDEEIVGNSGEAILTGDWAKEPLLIPDRHARCWQKTHPLATLRWTTEKNVACSRLFLRVARAIKWWRKNVSGGPEHPKSYPIEHMVGDHCPNDFKSVAEGVVRTLEAMYAAYRPFAEFKQVPKLTPRGLDPGDNNVLSLITPEDFADFVERLRIASIRARDAFDFNGDPSDAALLWQHVLGPLFPVPPSRKPSNGPSGPGSTGGFTAYEPGDPKPVGGRFA